MKKIIIAMIALSATVAVAAQNQERGFNVGDTVYVPRSAEYFLTGEHIAPWVYDEAQVIEVVGGVRFPEGVLLQPVNSWFTKESLLWEPEPAPEPEPQPQPEPQPVVEPAPVVEPEPVVEPAPVVEPEPVVEPAPAPEPEPEPVVIPEPKHDQHRLGVGARIGASSFMQRLDKNLPMVNGRGRLGCMGAIDVEYAWLRQLKSNPNIELGIRTGIGLNLASGRITATELTDSYVVADNETPVNHILYTVKAQKIKERQMQFMLEVPVLFSLRHANGLVFATGPKVNIPVLGRFTTTYTNPDINAHYVELGADMRNQLVTGKLTEVAPQTDHKLRAQKMNILWDVELGYEWKLKNQDGLALSAFADAPLAFFGYETGGYNTHFIQVGAPKAGGPEIKTYSIQNSYGTSMSYFDFGVKVTYYFCFGTK